jgi:hypothetical protein
MTRKTSPCKVNPKNVGAPNDVVFMGEIELVSL